MTERELIAIGFQRHGDGTLASPARVVLTPSGDAAIRERVAAGGKGWEPR